MRHVGIRSKQGGFVVVRDGETIGEVRRDPRTRRLTGHIGNIASMPQLSIKHAVEWVAYREANA